MVGNGFGRVIEKPRVKKPGAWRFVVTGVALPDWYQWPLVAK